MELVTITFDTDVKTVEEASSLITGLVHASDRTVQSIPIREFTGAYLSDAIIEMLAKVEHPYGVEDLIILTHSKIYYKLRKDSRDALEVERHSSKSGYAGTFVGHRFFAHSRIRPDTIIVGGKTGEKVRLFVGAKQAWSEDQFLIV